VRIITTVIMFYLLTFFHFANSFSNSKNLPISTVEKLSFSKLNIENYSLHQRLERLKYHFGKDWVSGFIKSIRIISAAEVAVWNTSFPLETLDKRKDRLEHKLFNRFSDSPILPAAQKIARELNISFVKKRIPTTEIFIVPLHPKKLKLKTNQFKEVIYKVADNIWIGNEELLIPRGTLLTVKFVKLQNTSPFGIPAKYAAIINNINSFSNLKVKFKSEIRGKDKYAISLLLSLAAVIAEKFPIAGSTLLISGENPKIPKLKLTIPSQKAVVAKLRLVLNDHQ